MLFVVKLFPEITIKSRPVRRRMIRLLRRNLKNILRKLDEGIRIVGEWDSIDIQTSTDEPALLRQIQEYLANTPGIAQFQTVQRHPLPDLDGIAALCKNLYAESLGGKTFAVRCKRSGKHSFSSVDVERHVGRVLLQQSPSASVKLKNPEVTVRLEIRHDNLYLVNQVFQGLGGYPLGSQDSVLSLISGGFDSAVSSYLCIKRGLLTHYCFFNLGGRAHELAVKEVALYLWMKYSSSHRVKFVSVPFEGVVEEILTKVDNAQMGVILKRMMLRAATNVADQLKIPALVTGESIAQVSSQTLPNLAVIDKVTQKLLIRPLVTSDKQDIINLARKIGTEEFSSNIPEYCGVISVKPTTRAKLDRIEHQESHFDMEVLERAVAHARFQLITDIARDLDGQLPEIKQTGQLRAGDTLIDIRHPAELEHNPLGLPARDDVQVLDIPFYQLQTYFEDKDKSGSYLLYCDKGMMSRLHAAHLCDQGFSHVAIYFPQSD